MSEGIPVKAYAAEVLHLKKEIAALKQQLDAAKAEIARKDRALTIAESWFQSYRFRHVDCAGGDDCNCGVRGAQEMIAKAISDDTAKAAREAHGKEG